MPTQLTFLAQRSLAYVINHDGEGAPAQVGRFMPDTARDELVAAGLIEPVTDPAGYRPTQAGRDAHVAFQTKRHQGQTAPPADG